MNPALCLELTCEEATLAAAARLAPLLTEGAVVFLSGELGAGKTTFSRGILRGLGHTGAVKSPTFTLVEPYDLGQFAVYHFDLYRLGDPEELEYIGFQDYFESPGLCIVEWPERGEDKLPTPDIIIRLEVDGGGRRLSLAPVTPRGEHIVGQFQASRESVL
ncbi:MAG: tRNA (adenosine(37)-N6)-threonylcarbamoyltransferase complex ATPase subunit type 1 TsaE [Pseudomonadota bacterium]